MRWPILALFFILVLPTIQYGLSSFDPETDARLVPEKELSDLFTGKGSTGLLIWEILPAFEMEYVILRNLASDPIDLIGMKLSDGEGSIAFGHLILPSGGEQVVCGDLSLFERIHDAHQTITFDDPSLTKKGRFILADAGDEVLLIDQSSAIIDALVYGASDYAAAGWNGDPCPKPGMGESLARLDAADSNRSVDWSVIVAGRAEIKPISKMALVEPFTFPEQGRERVLRELAYAQSSVRLAIYEISDRYVVGGLLNSLKRGVAVSLLIEAEPVGGRSKAENGALDALQAAGANVSMIKSYQGYKRFSYLHCKYLVVDERRLLVISENLVESSLDGNRGWGVVVESNELSRYFAKVFDSDSLSKRPDIQQYRPTGSQFAPLYNESNFDLDDIVKAMADVAAILSPDWSLQTLLRLISEANDRILVEQLYFEEVLLREHFLPALTAAANRGVEVRILLDNEWYNQIGTKNNTLAVELIEQEGDRLGLPLHAKLVSRYQKFETLHNKGMVVDGAVLVSSINWNLAALRENRECGLLVDSAIIAEFFAGEFENDWKDDPDPPEIHIGEAELEVNEGKPIFISAGNCSDVSGISRVQWDLFDDGTIEQTGRLFKAELGPGNYSLRLTIFDGFNNSASQLLRIHVIPEKKASSQEWVLVAFAAGSIIASWRVLVRIKRH
jgi:phosphatidylserine/phosphatidylglycerophosphate/cardiolipin synthase-like enzyme